MKSFVIFVVAVVLAFAAIHFGVEASSAPVPESSVDNIIFCFISTFAATFAFACSAAIWVVKGRRA